MHNLLPAQVTFAQLGQTVLLLKLKISSCSRRKLFLSVATFFRRSFGQSCRNLHKIFSFLLRTKICTTWPMVTWGVTKFLHKDPSWGNLDQFGQKDLVHVASSKARQQPLTEARTGVDHTSASLDNTNQFGANGSCSARGFHWGRGRRMYDTFSVRGRNWSQKGLHRVHLLWKVKAFYWGHDEPCVSLHLIEVSRTLA